MRTNSSGRNLYTLSLEPGRAYFLSPSLLKYNWPSISTAKTYFWNDNQEEINLISIFVIIHTSNDIKETSQTLTSNFYREPWPKLLYKNVNLKLILKKFKSILSNMSSLVFASTCAAKLLIFPSEDYCKAIPRAVFLHLVVITAVNTILILIPSFFKNKVFHLNKFKFSSRCRAGAPNHISLILSPILSLLI